MSSWVWKASEKKHRKLLKKWHCGCDKQLLTFLCANQLMSGVVSLVSPVWQMHYIYLHRKMSREPSCSSGLWQDPVFFIIKQQFNLNIDEKTPKNFWLKLSLWCFSSQFKKKVFIHFAKKGKKDRKAFPSLVSVHCQHMKYSMWFLLCERNKNEKRELGRLMLWSFMHKHIGEKKHTFPPPRPSKLSAWGLLAVIVSNKAV